MNTTLAGMVEGLSDLQALTQGVREICVAVLDGPIDRSHPVLRGSALGQLGGLDNAELPSAAVHGTAVTSILFGQPGSVLAGIAPGCQGLHVPIFSYDEQGQLLPCSQLELARAILLAVSAGADLINISGGELLAHGAAEPLLERAVAECEQRGVLVVAAAGNDACACSHLPAALPWVLVVGAMDRQGLPLMESNWGEEYRDHGILAPGQEIPVALPNGATGLLTGTSMAAPIVSGVAALLLSLQYAQGLVPDSRAVRRALLDSARRCPADDTTDCRQYLAGSLDVTGAYRRVRPHPADADHEVSVKNPRQKGTFMSTIFPNSSDELLPQPAYVHPDLPGSVPASLIAGVPYSHGAVAPSVCAECQRELANKEGTAPAKPSPTKVYVLGTIGYEFISDSRHDSLAQAMAVPDAGRADAFLRHVEDNPHVAESVVWTVRMDSTPIYALYPTGAYARSTYERLVELLRAQEAGAVHRVSIPGIAPGATARTRSGQTLPVLFPELRGMYGWTTESLVASVCGPRPADEAGQEQHAAKAQRVLQFLERVYYELRNLGVTPQERALNFAATNAYQVEQVYAHALGESMELHKIDVVKSPVARPGADSWDVKLTFFHPERRLERASVEYRFTVDVSDVMPLTTGPVRKWSVF